MTPKQFIEKQDNGYVAGDYTPSEVCEFMNDYARHIIDEVLKLYVPDGNPIVWKEKILELRLRHAIL
jgi:hypothetical protein